MSKTGTGTVDLPASPRTRPGNEAERSLVEVFRDAVRHLLATGQMDKALSGIATSDLEQLVLSIERVKEGRL